MLYAVCCFEELYFLMNIFFCCILCCSVYLGIEPGSLRSGLMVRALPSEHRAPPPPQANPQVQREM